MNKIKNYKETKSEALTGSVRFSPTSIEFGTDENYLVGKPFKEDYSGRIAFEPSSSDAIIILFDPDGTYATIIAEFYKIIYETKLKEKPCP